MRFFVLLAAFAIAFGPAAAAQDQGRAPHPPGAVPERDAASNLDKLFERLKDAKDESEADGLVRLIERRWLRSGSDTADLLMDRAQQAIRSESYPVAIEILDRVLALRPDWAEAWNRRAVAFYLLDDPVASMADLNRAITLEPRHFGAWAGLGHMLRAGGRDREALAAYERALAINPRQQKIQDLVERMRREVQGVDL